jgi:hypothetical protein
MLKTFQYDEIEFTVGSSQQFATVMFDRADDEETTLITVMKDGKINQLDGDNTFNPSSRRHASCVYVKEECGRNIIEICTIQHKGTTLVEVHSVSLEEMFYLFKNA